MDLQKPIEWHELKSGARLAIQDNQLLCIVEKIEDLPVEGWCPNILQDTFTTPEGAMAAGEKILGSIERHARSHDEPPTPGTEPAFSEAATWWRLVAGATIPDPLVLKIGRSAVERTPSGEATAPPEAKT